MPTTIKDKEIELRILGDARGFKRYSRDLGVYIIQSGEYYKIGYTTNLLGRIDALKTANPHNELKIILWIMTSEAKLLEKALHELMKERRSFREWFRFEDTDIKKILGFIEQWWLIG
jgi:hypothetical protein